MTTFSHDEVKNTKSDIQVLLKRLQNLKEESKKALCKDTEQLVSSLLEMKDNLTATGCHQLKVLCKLIKGHPVKSAFYIFISGIILAKIFKKD